MNIKVITRHMPSNYGSLLQCIATQRAIEALGHHCEIINYVRKDERGLQGILSSIVDKKEWSRSPLKKIAYIILRYPGEWMAQQTFDHMRKVHLKLTPVCYTQEELKQLKADVFMTGSDQVWGPLFRVKYDPTYFLDFADSHSKKISYAASFGRTEFTPDILQAYKLYMSTYTHLTVRENSAVELLKNLNLHCDGQVLDPTLLIDKSQWYQYIKKEVKDKYVLIYEIHNNPQLDDYAKRFATHVNLPLVRVTPTLHQAVRGGKMVFLPNIGKFLSYIKNATYMVTDSFHGTAFAINLNTQFIEVLPNTQTRSRNQSILQLTGLQDRIVTDFNDFSLANKKIDFEKVNNIIATERLKSIEALKTIIEQ
ncbi:MAG: polysaccharide pyruvyl transferase family protein [Bacteroides uniformis]|jgi:hypothetical protein|nr:polysaccharide pyruvyl transferase family protein [Bacteroides uniformis]